MSGITPTRTCSACTPPDATACSTRALVTLTLFFFCLFKWGFLAALGFAFFEAVGSAFGLYYNLHTLLEGRVPNPWISRIIIWCVSLGLVAMLV